MKKNMFFMVTSGDMRSLFHGCRSVVWSASVLLVALFSCHQEPPEAALRDERKIPVAGAFSPKEVKGGETVRIEGKHFAEGTPDVRIGGEYAVVLGFDNNTIRFVVPLLNDAPYPIEVYNVHGVGITKEMLNVLRR